MHCVPMAFRFVESLALSSSCLLWSGDNHSDGGIVHSINDIEILLAVY